MANEKELLLDYLITLIEKEYGWFEGKDNLNQYAVGKADAYGKLYEVIKKYNK